MKPPPLLREQPAEATGHGRRTDVILCPVRAESDRLLVLLQGLFQSSLGLVHPAQQEVNLTVSRLLP